MTGAVNEIFAVLADPTRRAILESLIRDGEQTVWMLTERSNVSQPAVSKHLNALKHAGLVHGRQEGRQTHYSIQSKGLEPLVNWLQFYTAFWHERFDRIEDILKRMDQ